MNTSEKKSPARIVVPLVLVLGAGAGAWFWWSGRPADDAAATYHGNVDIRDVTLAFRIAGRVDSVAKNEGDVVEAGEVLAHLEDAPYRVALAQVSAATEVARAQLARVVAGSRREDIAEARAMLAERHANHDRARDTLGRYEGLAKTGAVTEQALLNARASEAQAQASVRAAQAVLARVVDGSREEDVAVARAQLAQAEAAVATAELNLSDTTLKSSTAGRVVTRAIEPGAIVAPGSPALVVSFDKPVWIRAFATEAQLPELAPGTVMDVSIDGRAEPYRGKVGYVATQAEFTPKNVETAELRTSLVYRFRVIVDTHDGGLRQGMPVTLRRAPSGD